MKKIYTPVHIKYLKKIYAGRHISEITKIFNKHFKMKVNPLALKAVAQKNKIRSTWQKLPNYIHWNKKYFDIHINYLRKITPGRHYAEIKNMFNKRFGFKLTERDLSNLLKKSGLTTGLKGYFPKKHIPWNKGMKGVCAPGSEKGWFKKGHKPKNTMPLGSERITKDGIIEVKISNTSGNYSKRWKSKHSVIWQKAHGKIPKGSVIIFADGNRRNFNLSNLICVTRNELYQLNKKGLISPNGELTKAARALVALWIKKNEIKRQSIEKTKSKKINIFDNAGKKVFVAHGLGRNKKRWIAVRETKNGLQELRAECIKARVKFDDALRDLKEYALLRGWQKT